MNGFHRLGSETEVSRLLNEPIRVGARATPPRITIQPDWDAERTAKRTQQAELKRLVSSLRQTFPSRRAPRSSASSASSDVVPRAPQVTLLLVDDDATVRMVVTDMLVHLGYTVLNACDGQEAIELLDQYAPQVSLVLMDVRMPRMDAKAALPILEARWPTLPVLLSSGDETEATLKTWHRPNVVGFLPKPYAMSALQQALVHATCARTP